MLIKIEGHNPLKFFKRFLFGFSPLKLYFVDVNFVKVTNICEIISHTLR